MSNNKRFTYLLT